MSRARPKSTKKRKTAAKKTAARKQRVTKRFTKSKTEKSFEAETYVESPNVDERELVLLWFRLLARSRGAWLQHLWMSDGDPDGQATVTHAELAGILSDHDSPQAEAEWSARQEPVRRWEAEANEIKELLSTFGNSRFTRLAGVFGLTPDELDLLRLAAAIGFDPALGRVCAYLHDHAGRTYLTEELAARLLKLNRGGVWNAEMNVFRWELIQRRDAGVGEPQALICDPQIRSWLLGRSSLDEVLVPAARVVELSGFLLPEWPVDALVRWIDETLRSEDPRRLRIIVVGPKGAGKRNFAAGVVAQLGMPLLAVDSDAVDESQWNRFFMHVQRQVFLDSGTLAWTGDTITRHRWPANQPLFPLQFVLCEPGSEPTPINGAVDRVVRLSMPEARTREYMWLRSAKQALKWPKDELRKLSEHHRVWPGDIDRATVLGASNPAEAAALVRDSARSRFGNLAQILECPFTEKDLVLPKGLKQLLETISFEAEARQEFWRQDEARRLFPQGRGLVALFSGPSGTGKTMAAQVIARRLTQDLCRVNVAQLVSKWVGETPKNVEQVIRVAAENDVVLFFDEADALFARRSTEIRDAQDRFANTDTAFLLQAIESYPGIAILATNLKTNIDSAFLRRLRYVVEFPKPDASLQRELWAKLVTALAGEDRAEALVPAFELLSSATEVTGAQIKFALLTALFAARAEKKILSAGHLLLGLDRELAKEGRAIGPRHRDRILSLEKAA